MPNVDTENVEFKAGDAQMKAYVAKPKSEGKHPAIVVIHDNRGLNDQIRGVARRFAAEGFVALAPDLLASVGGKVSSPEEVPEAIAALPTFVAISELKATVDYLEKDPGVDAQKISAVGFGWGGYRSFFFAIAEPRLYRAVVFYGTAPDSGFEMIKAPILAHYAKGDNRVTGNALLIAEQMKKRGKKFEYYIYDNTDDGFFNEASPHYNAAAANLAWKRTLDFLNN